MRCNNCAAEYEEPSNSRGELVCKPCYRERANARQRQYIAGLTPEQKLARNRAGNVLMKRKGWPAQTRYRKANPDKVKAAWRSWYQANPEAMRARSALSRALRRGVTGNKVLIDDLLTRDGEWCCLCGLPLGEDTTIDHLKPINSGGTHEVSNLGLAHRSCNSSKGDKPFISWALSAQRPA